MNTIYVSRNGQIEPILEINRRICGLAYIPDFEGILYVTGRDGRIWFVGLEDGFHDLWINDKEHRTLDAICYCNDNRSIYLETDEDIIVRIATEDQTTRSFSSRRTRAQWPYMRTDKPLINRKLNAIEYDSSKNTVWFCSPEHHAVFNYARSRVTRVIGSGKKGMRYSSQPDMIDFNTPSGLAWDKKKRMLYVSDTGNNLIYMFSIDHMNSPKIEDIVGSHSTKEYSEKTFFMPTILSVRLDSLFIVDGKMTTIKVMSLMDKSIKELHRTDNVIVDMDMISKNEFVFSEES